jgi:hypothetical protein
MTKDTYYITKETYYMTKEAYYMTKETYTDTLRGLSAELGRVSPLDFLPLLDPPMNAH